jgi:NDP-sugar pyrophosphorylase family protein
MLEDFFNTINVPDFLREEFDKEDWYLLISKFKRILDRVLQDESISESNQRMLAGKKALTLVTHGKVHIGENCTIGEFVVIEGPVYIGNNVEIGPGVYIREGSIISDGCSIAHAAQVKNSLMMAGSKISNHVFLGDSIIGVNARLGGHCETSNRRFDQQAIEFSYRAQKLFTGLEKLGLILGEGSRLGGSCVTSPGSMIGKNSFIGTATPISGFIEPNKFVKLESQYKIVNNNFSGSLKYSNLFDKKKLI